MARRSAKVPKKRKRNLLSLRRQRLTSAIRKIWSWEVRSKIVKAAGGKCVECGSEEALNVHHLTMIGWQRIIDVITEELWAPTKVVCKPCHKQIHDDIREKKKAEKNGK